MLAQKERTENVCWNYHTSLLTEDDRRRNQAVMERARASPFLTEYEMRFLERIWAHKWG
jgi:hypothetical protein